MKTRTCPNCDYKYSRKEYLGKLLFKMVWSSWRCPNCHSLITFNFGRRVLIAIVFGVLILAAFFVRDNFELGFTEGLLLLILLGLSSLFLSTFDTFTLKEEDDEKSGN